MKSSLKNIGANFCGHVLFWLMFRLDSWNEKNVALNEYRKIWNYLQESWKILQNQEKSEAHDFPRFL